MRVLVRPGKDRSELREPSEFERARCDIIAIVKSPPEGGKANREVSALLEARFGTDFLLASGAASRLKVFKPRVL